ncbi:hypothetical protein KKC22_13715 [Myxococcota bacterium]|nr:hypothetical protein [Myxococcota bacterium]
MRTMILIAVLLMMWSGCDSNTKAATPEDCGNALDDDRDGLLDCQDPDCAAFAGCAALNNVNNTNNQTFSIVPLPGIRLGINKGHRNTTWNDQQTADLAVRAGVNSSRISLPMSHLETWGYEIEVQDIAYYRDHGIDRHLVAFLTKPTVECSTAPAGTADWELAYHMPAGLYEPIWLSEGVVNPANCWARYVFDAVTVYKDVIDIWEIWNEPDWVADWHDTLTWWDEPPTAGQLPRFNGNIFNYIRLLRVSAEVIRHIAPDALVATGGLGYPSFVDALLRYTDNPADGSATEAYPHRGGHWFDVHSIHYYPIFGGGNSDTGVEGFLAHLQDHVNVLSANGSGPRTFIVTESGAPHLVVDDNPGGPEYARNYLLKVIAKARAEGVSGIDWFLLTDTAPPSELSSPFDYMGLFLDTADLSSPDDAVMTETGIAHATLSLLASNAESFAPLDGEVTGSGIDGVVMRFSDRMGYILWAVADSGEDGATTAVVTGTRPLIAYAWNYSADGDAMFPLDAGDSIPLTSSPVILVEQ